MFSYILQMLQRKIDHHRYWDIYMIQSETWTHFQKMQWRAVLFVWRCQAPGNMWAVEIWHQLHYELLPNFSYLGSMIEALPQHALYKWQYFGQNMTDFSKQIKGKLMWLSAVLDYLCACGFILLQHVWKYVANHNLWCKNEKHENEWRWFFSSHCCKILCWWCLITLYCSLSVVLSRDVNCGSV